MAITYNAIGEYLQYIYRYDASAGTYSDNLADLTDFDYFDDACTAGDILYFAGRDNTAHEFYRSDYEAIRTLRLNVGASFAAADVTFAWEYRSRSAGWTALPNLVDGTAGFSNLGTNDITWDMPDDLTETTIKGAVSYTHLTLPTN